MKKMFVQGRKRKQRGDISALKNAYAFANTQLFKQGLPERQSARRAELRRRRPHVRVCRPLQCQHAIIALIGDQQSVANNIHGNAVRFREWSRAGRVVVGKGAQVATAGCGGARANRQ